ncbi:uncharacterized protein P174DRAFT_450571 [Aspergillus novofumigatus IBT 16806]|uniref:Uncharacterized protein n=1 Tax=Aspergillus novofumigatus (strain IBT 16806) TaxID=1392255 RepID=A0A2I1C7H5_ASPN1|nr:uncharacterized protein P174DRAFT_450571 [Aspergillus novofumigatus IBT 16806]PKX93590.1 hypothetical protein P174DRAFT_450571 [Aspergillus novofumigatus IBT 16806]
MADYIEFGGVHVDFNTNIIMIAMFLCVLAKIILSSPLLAQLVRNRYGETCVCPVVNHFHYNYDHHHDHDHDHGHNHNHNHNHDQDHDHHLRHREVRR